uniref:uncharacterized protein LOC100390772 isoform X1 n=1 Tax=Callithrix jacchus TaxID=9483 RepID=UPI0023DD638F|nr:uncharacterized protein LOC100390772 isoform X1 [Callithrix jacchus]
MELSSMKICTAIPTSRALTEVVRRMPRKRISGLEVLLPQDQNHSESPGQKDVDTAKEYGDKTRHIYGERETSVYAREPRYPRVAESTRQIQVGSARSEFGTLVAVSY